MATKIDAGYCYAYNLGYLDGKAQQQSLSILRADRSLMEATDPYATGYRDAWQDRQPPAACRKAQKRRK